MRTIRNKNGIIFMLCVLILPTFVYLYNAFIILKYYCEVVFYFTNISSKPSTLVLYGQSLEIMPLSWQILNFISYCLPGIVFSISWLYLMFYTKMYYSIKERYAYKDKNWFFKTLLKFELLWDIWRVRGFRLVMGKNLQFCCYLIFFLNLYYFFFIGGSHDLILNEKILLNFLIVSILPTIFSFYIIISDYTRRLKVYRSILLK